MGVLNPIVDPLSDWDNLPLSHARIGWNNLLNAASDTSAANALSPNTFQRWTSASGTMQATFQPTGIATIDYVAIAGHNLGSVGASLIIATAPTVAGTFTDVAAINPSNDDALMFLIPRDDSVADVRLTITGGTNREIAVVHAGLALQMYQPIYGGHTPQDLAPVTEYQSSISESGQFLGRRIIRKGSQTTFAWQHLDPIWYRERFKPFQESARLLPFFIKWRPDLYETTIYNHATADIAPSNMGGHDLMAVSMPVRGHDDI